jgi:ribosome maturation factor RimP
MWGKVPHIFYYADLRNHMSDDLEQLVATELDAIGYDLVELRRGGSRARPTLQLRIDRRDGVAVRVDDCAQASRRLESALEASGKVSEQYTLEVSSPGVDRPLRTAAEWRRFVGQPANVLSPLLGGRMEVEILGVEGEGGNETIVVRTPRGEEQRVALADVKEARLAFHW